MGIGALLLIFEGEESIHVTCPRNIFRGEFFLTESSLASCNIECSDYNCFLSFFN